MHIFKLIFLVPKNEFYFDPFDNPYRTISLAIVFKTLSQGMNSLLLDSITFFFTRFLKLVRPVDKMYSFSPLKCFPFFTLLFRNISTCVANSLNYFLEGVCCISQYMSSDQHAFSQLCYKVPNTFLFLSPLAGLQEAHTHSLNFFSQK